MESLRTVAWRHAGPERGVGIHALAGCRARQHLQHHFEILETRHDFLDASQGNQGARQGEAHAAVALRLDHGDRPGFGNEEVGATDGGGNIEEFPAQIIARRRSERLRVVGKILEPHPPGKYLAHLAAIDVQRRSHDVRGFFLAELENNLSQIGLKDLNARGLEKRIQLNHGRGHGLDLDHLGGFFLAQNLKNDAARAGGVCGPVNRAPRGSAALFKLLKICAEILKDVVANRCAGIAQRLPIVFFGHHAGALGLNHVSGVGHVLSQLRIAQHREGGHGKRRRQRGIEHGMAPARSVRSAAAHASPSAGSDSVLARISAM